MQGRKGEDEIRAKMAELGLICDKESEIRHQKLQSATLSFHKYLQSSKSKADQSISINDNIGKLKAELRAAEDDYVKALSVKNRKEKKKMTLSDSISATKARIEELKKIVADQRTRKDEYTELISYQSKVLKECEEKHMQDAECIKEIEEAFSWYNRVLGFRIERGRGIKFIFTNMNPKNPSEEYSFTIRLENDIYALLDCQPHLGEANRLIQELNVTNGLYSFVRTMRAKFQEVAAVGSLPKIASNPQETTLISMSAPLSSVSTESGSSAKDDHSRQANRVGKKLRSIHGIQSSVLSPGSASSLRRSPRFKVKK
uniref:kinetochore protein SPC25 homolog isoform X2 n=1 Tax=Erigeron canadensis TaxID=72917 RepID=UPI001CB8922D|nr:kinetochore protein SPC25 homolog isoform X2 [Erigeron canadensis]